MTMTNDNTGGIKQNSDYNREFTLKDPDHDEIKDGYQLRWVGKNYAKLQENLRPETVIVPDAEHNAKSVNEDSQNLFLTGDNLEVLKHLEYSYTGKVDMIYIDPPYNTGSDGFVYDDNFRFTDEQLRDTLGLTEAEVKKIRNIYGKASHSAWLTFMYPRLKLAKKLLSDTGVIFVSIDENEHANLKLLMDEIFNEGNFVSDIVWEKRFTRSNNARMFTTLTERILLYRRSNSIDYLKDERDENNGSTFSNPDNDPRGDWTSVSYVNPASKSARPNLSYDLANPHTGVSVSHPTNAWKYSYDTYLSHVKEGRLYWGQDGNNTYPRLKRFLGEMDGGVVPVDLWRHTETGTTDKASKDLEKLIGRGIFDFPKPIGLIEKMMRIATNREEDALILDFFAGSGTTAHAVMNLNKTDGGNRKFIACTLDEPVKKDSEAEKAGFETIDQIARKRIELAAEQLGDASGFRHYRFKIPSEATLDQVEDFDPSMPTIVADDMITPFSEKMLTGNGSSNNGTATILATWLVDDGYDFNTKAEVIDLAGYNAYYAKDIARLYLIDNKGWSKEACKQLLNHLGKNEIAVNAIVIYAYSFNFVDLTELKNNLKANLDKTPQIIERY